ncbi:MAG: hypothetical protein ACLTSX_12550 [Collinsella sp.]
MRRDEYEAKRREIIDRYTEGDMRPRGCGLLRRRGELAQVDAPQA